MTERVLQVGDDVHVTNEYGVNLGRKTIVEITTDRHGLAYYIAPTQAHWMHWRAECLRYLPRLGGEW